MYIPFIYLYINILPSMLSKKNNWIENFVKKKLLIN